LHRRRLDWDVCQSLFDDAVWLRRPDTRQLNDDDVLKVMEIMQSDLFPSIGVETVRHGVQAAAAGNTFHPVREYLESLPWDGVSRAGRLFTAYFPCASEDPEYLSAVGKKFLVGAVARVMHPGCKVDTMATKGRKNQAVWPRWSAINGMATTCPT
jgi:predicted P-loop ATPase